MANLPQSSLIDSYYLSHELDQKKEDIKNTLASGTCTTYDEYRYLVGFYKGLSESEIILTDLEKKYLSGEDFEDAKR